LQKKSRKNFNVAALKWPKPDTYGDNIKGKNQQTFKEKGGEEGKNYQKTITFNLKIEIVIFMDVSQVSS
jgi:hypothetical protein